jgi:hypothetical protein
MSGMDIIDSSTTASENSRGWTGVLAIEPNARLAPLYGTCFKLFK